MSWWKRLLLPAALLALVTAPVRAQVAGHPFELSAGAGYHSYDVADHLKDAPAFTAAFGYRATDPFTWQLAYLYSGTKSSLADATKHDWSYVSADLVWMVRDPAERSTAFVFGGIGIGRSHVSGRDALLAGAPSIGLGLRYNLAGNPRLYLNVQARDVMFREQDAMNFSQRIAATVSFTHVFGGRYKDQDLDGVRNWLDQCPNTPIGAKVDAKGCPLDGDGDGVYDGLDKCPDTPKGCKVDKTGCSIDSDGDGVCDGIDQCANTPKGAVVDAKGCPIDSDGDGVYDGLDQCANTPKGAVVDAKGCPVDTDGDGVPDGLDQCPNTPAGAKVDANGCPTELGKQESDLLQTGTIRLGNVNFDTNKATIVAASDSVLDAVATILLQYPALTLEVGGHTDATGAKDKNLALSEARAKSVVAYLTGKYPTLDASHFTAKGYGSSVPVAKNTNEAGRALNRRVEFKVTSLDVLKAEREKRHIVVPAPADSTAH